MMKKLFFILAFLFSTGSVFFFSVTPAVAALCLSSKGALCPDSGLKITCGSCCCDTGTSCQAWQRGGQCK